jgi:hypothetical protein
MVYNGISMQMQHNVGSEQGYRMSSTLNVVILIIGVYNN